MSGGGEEEDKGERETGVRPVTYGRLDQTPCVMTDGFEHLNNFLLFNDGLEVMVKAISGLEALTSNLVQCVRTPLSPSCRFYRMTLGSIGDGHFVMLGLTNKCLPGSPMWTIDRSVRYHSNDGGVFNGGLGIRTYHPYKEGDTVTCRLDYVGPDRSLINFLLNDCFVYRQWVNLPPDQLYATIGVSRSQCQMTVEWPEPDRGDIAIRNDLPSNWFGWKGITRNNEAMTFTLTYPDEATKREAYNVQCPLAFSKEFNYFEIEVLKKASDKEGQGVGLVSGNCEAFVYPGWTAHTIGYHNDDGGLYVNGEDAEQKSRAEFRCGAGDRMGCGVVFPPAVKAQDQREPILLLVYFTRNGALAYTKRMRQPRGGFFPCIALFHTGDAVRLDVTVERPDFHMDLTKALTTPEASADYRCNEIFALKDLSHSAVTIRMTTDTDTAQLLQYRAEPLRNLGDRFTLQLTEFGEDTEVQMGVSPAGSRLEGEFLGAESTSCGYMLKLGTVVSKDGMRAVTKWDPLQKQTIGCYLDYIDDSGAVVCFTINDRLIGRGTVSRATGCNSALYASIVMSAGPAEVKADWTGILNSTKIERTQRGAGDWIRPTCIQADGGTLQLKPSNGYAFAASAQSSLPLVTGSAIFSIRLLSGQELPGIGLSRATNDVNNVLGSENGDICFVPSAKHILANNMKKKVAVAPDVQLGDTLQCGLIFSRPADRVAQKVVVFFAINGVMLHHCRMQALYGGLYPTVAFSSSGGSVEVIAEKPVLPVPDEISRVWMKEKSSDSMNVSAESPFALNDLVRRMSTLPQVEAFLPKSTVDTTIKLYASHAFSDREAVDGIMKQLQKTQPYVAVETSTSRASMQDKNEALSAADLVVLFVGDAYYLSHEMQTEYEGIIREKEIPAVLCALDNKGWPPHTYFCQLEDELSRLPWVELTLTQQGKPSIGPLERYLDKKLHERLDLSQGECPWVPNALSADVKTAWVEGVQWESRHFDEKAPRRVDTLTDATRREQSRALWRLFKETYSQSDRHLFFQTALQLERLVLTVGVPTVFMMEAATACYLCRAEQSGAYPCVLDLSDRLRGAFDLDPVFDLIVREVDRRFTDEPRMKTAVDWFGNFLLSVPESRRPALTQHKVDTMFLALIFEPSQLADQRPSVSAGAVLTHLMGAEEAEPYLCGYDLFDVSAALSEVTNILTSDHITTQSPLQESED